MSTAKNRVCNGKLFVICPTCGELLRFSKKLEALVLHADTFSCPSCDQRSKVPKELKQYIMYF